MCGIVGVSGPGAAQKAFEGMKTLEYRGYDSWGMCYQSGKKLVALKRVGKIDQTGAPQDSLDSPVALAHRRWATHGGVSEQNAHPHFSNNGKIAIIHNGIVENYEVLRNALKQKGYKFHSETDTEVIVNLIEEALKTEKTFEGAVRAALLQTEGNYAIVAMRENDDNLVCAKGGSPLVIGQMQDGFFAASDATAFIRHTKKAIYPRDGEIAVIGKSIKLISLKSGQEVPVEVKTLEWDYEQAQKGDFEHFMLKEINEQPKALLRAAAQPVATLEKFVSLIKNAERIYLLGCGSSYHACMSSSYFFSKIASIQATPVLASEHALYNPFFNEKSLVIGISQSGETADLIEAMHAAKSGGAKIASIVNVMDSTIMRMSDCTLLLNAGPEIGVLSTKSYTSQIALMLLVAHATVGTQAKAKKLIGEIATGVEKSILSLDSQLKNLASEIARSKDIFVIGREEGYPAALEAALKIKEVSYIHAEGFAGGELKHGTIALVEKGTPIIVLSNLGAEKNIMGNAIELKSRGARIIGVGSSNKEIYDTHLQISNLSEGSGITSIVPIQLLAYYLAVERGYDPDKPRNLAKSVTVK